MFQIEKTSFTLKTRALLFVSVLAAYTIFAFFGLELASINKYASPIWIASGIAIGSVTLLGNWIAPSVYIGAFVINYLQGMQPQFALASAFGNMLEAIVAAYLINFIMRKNYFKSYSEFFSIFFGSVLPSIISATFGTFFLYVDSVVTADNFTYAWYTWWSGDSIGALIVLPIFLELFSKKESKHSSPKSLLWGPGFATICLGVTYLVFVKDMNQAFSWSLTPILIVSGVMLGRLYSRTLLVILATCIVVLTSYGYGPFEYGDKNLDFICIQSLLTSYAIAILFVRPLNTRYKISYKYALGIASGWVTLFAVIYYITIYERKYILEDYSKSTDVAVDSIIKASKQYELLLESTSALFAIKPEVSQEDWKIYSDSLHLGNSFDAITGIGYMRSVKKKNRLAYEKKMGFKIKVLDPVNSKNYDDHIVVTYLEPRQANIAALGLDGGSELSRREAANRARTDHLTIATKPITLIQDLKQRKAFLIFRPLWNINNEFMGWTYAPVISPVFFGKAIEKISHLLRIKVSVDDDNIYRTADSDDGHFRNNSYQNKKEIILFGLPHQLDFYPTNLFFKRHSGYSVYLALVLNLFMLLIAAFLLEQLTFSQRAEAMIEARTKELEDSRMQLINASKMASLGEMASGLAHEINKPPCYHSGKSKSYLSHV